MIDLHCHILPGLDDGASSIEVSIEMARMAVADGITHMACTPHVFPGKYENDSAVILPAIRALQSVLDDHKIPLKLLCGADAHISLELIDRIKKREIPTLNDTRYFLLEPPHQVLPPRLIELAEKALAAGYVPIVTHPERLLWGERHYEIFIRLSKIGCLLQLTAGSLLGEFGTLPRILSERLLNDGRVGLVATDAHGVRHRRPILSAAYDHVVTKIGSAEADELFVKRPMAIISNVAVKLENQGRADVDKSRSSGSPISKILGRIFEGR